MAEEQPWVYANVEQFFSQLFRFQYRRRIDGSTRVWSARWWESEEAFLRVSLLHQMWETARVEGTLAAWWREVDYTMDILMDPEGPLEHARTESKQLDTLPNQALPHETIPIEYFPDSEGTS